ncbi:beta-lactamase family protein [Sphingobacterium sp. N143]|uniref:serine hydrolase domain-containing protein n=1 Tax=Sphingobacterium sp. N143 TaxID=2746727 RepID=UPI002574C513|nr:serine hydrolase domain-containing protein [Sphingobacterium sp. N143]MDM1292819.1 beta-lactamase family protein [Sphingobacterium sp. N143]
MKHLITTILLGITSYTFAQTKPQEQINRAVYNRLEFFINSQLTDSAYNLASDSFKTQYNLPRFTQMLEEIYPLGRVKSSDILSFEKGLATYRMDFDNQSYEVKFAADSTLKFSTLHFSPMDTAVAEQPLIAEKTEAPVTSRAMDKDDFLIDSIANSYLKQANTQSLAIGVVKNGQVKTYFYGETAQGNQTTPTNTSIYEVGSLSKVFTAILLSNLVEQGTITLDQPIALFLPDTLKKNEDLSKITFKMLANHTSGFPGLPDNLEKTNAYNPNDPYKSYDKKMLYNYLSGFKNKKVPGEEYEYSDLGYAILGDIISDIYKKPYDQAVREIICKPLDMNNTFEVLDPKKKDTLKVYNKDGQEVTPLSYHIFSSASGLKSTLEDLLKFTSAQFKMPQTALENAMANTRLFTFFLPPDTDIGLAWHMNLLDDLTIYWHNGRTAGSSSYLALSPDKKSAVVVLSNSALPVDEKGKMILDHLLHAK